MFSSSAAWRTIIRNAVSSFSSSTGDSDRMSTSIQVSNGIELTDVPPPTTPTLNVVFGVCGTWMADSFCIAAPIANAGLTRPNAP